MHSIRRAYAALPRVMAIQPYWAPSLRIGKLLLLAIVIVNTVIFRLIDPLDYPTIWLKFIVALVAIQLLRVLHDANRLRLAHKLLRQGRRDDFMGRMDQPMFRAWLRNQGHAEFTGFTNAGALTELPRKEQLTLALLFLRFIAWTDPWYKPHNLRLRAKYIAGRIGDMLP